MLINVLKCNLTRSC